MKILTQQISADVAHLAEGLSKAENLMALECARKVMNHMKRHLISGNKPDYKENIEVLSEIINIHASHLMSFDSLKTA